VGHVEAEALLAVERGDTGTGQHDLVAVRLAHRRDGAVLVRLGEVASEGIPRLVAVRVTVEDAVVEVAHGPSFLDNVGVEHNNTTDYGRPEGGGAPFRAGRGSIHRHDRPARRPQHDYLRGPRRAPRGFRPGGRR